MLNRNRVIFLVKSCGLRFLKNVVVKVSLNPNLTLGVILKSDNPICTFVVQKYVKEVTKSLASIGIKISLRKIENLNNEDKSGTYLSFNIDKFLVE